MAKYAHATAVTLRVSREASRVLVEIADNGIGGADETRGSGLRGLADRLDALNGTLRISSPPGEGTTLTAELPMRVVISDDNMLVRDGLAALLREAGVHVAAQAASVDELLREVERCEPDVAIVDIRMPPTNTDEGLRAAHEIRTRQPQVGILILSQFVEVGTVTRLLAQSAERLGYLLKDRVTDIEDFVATLQRVADGGSALDPKVLAHLLAARPREDPLRALTPREREVLALVAEGRSNKGIADRMVITEGAVQKYVTSIFAKLDLPAGDDDHRRVLSVLTYLRR